MASLNSRNQFLDNRERSSERDLHMARDRDSPRGFVSGFFSGGTTNLITMMEVGPFFNGQGEAVDFELFYFPKPAKQIMP